MNKALLLEAGTATVSDALDMLGLNNGLGSEIDPLMIGMKAVGPAYTLKVEAVAPGEAGKAGDYIDDIPTDAVIVIANRGETQCTVWGDILSYVAKKKGIAGTVIDGACRDVDGIVAIDYPVFSKAAYMKSGKGRVSLREKNVPVVINQTVVNPGDIVCADGAGVVVIPMDRLAEVETLVSEIIEMEKKVLSAVDLGVSLKEARAAQNYNSYGRKAS
jgi:4-hydroxy-4-methyl-2-oxoglutarate aldolase